MKFSNTSPILRRQGFTLVEILVVISIMVVLMALTIGIGRWALLNAQVQKCTVQVKLFEKNIQDYDADNGEFPPGDGSERSSIDLYEALYEFGIENDSKVYMAELAPKRSDQFQKRIERDGTILDPFKKTDKPYYYMRAVDENGETRGDAFNPDFDLWSLGPNGVGRGSEGSTDEDFDDDIHNW